MSTSNGKATNGAAKENQVANTTSPAIKPELSDLHVSVPVPKPALTIQQRLDRFYQLERLNERREDLLDALKKVESFQISPTGAGENLRFSDGKGNTFAIAHPIVIGEMVNLAKTKLQAQLAEVEAQFIF